MTSRLPPWDASASAMASPFRLMFAVGGALTLAHLALPDTARQRRLDEADTVPVVNWIFMTRRDLLVSTSLGIAGRAAGAQFGDD